MDIKSLLNSPVNGSRQRRNEPSSSPRPFAQHYLADNIAPKRQKLAKDAPVFAEGTKVVGHVNYPPHEAGRDRDLELRHRDFGVFPLGQIYRKGVRHIPYASDKKDFLEKTGREAFEVFQYTYKKPGEEKPYVVVWDYNTGLVRMTPFFKSCKFSKTVPAKALNQNPGLRDISYSITGGALVCQGYWVPWQAARELAATFCWSIRWALTPVFGNDFPQMCRPPHDHTFGKFVINPNTVRFCQTETDRLKQEGLAYQLLLPRASPLDTTSPMSLFTPPIWGQDALASPPESGYGTDVEHNKAGSADPISPLCQYRPGSSTSVHAESPTICNTAYISALCSPVIAPAPTPLSRSPPVPSTPQSARFRTKRAHSKAVSDGCNDAVIRIDTPMYVSRDDSDRPRDSSLRTIQAAEILVSIGVVVRNAMAMPEPKRARRGSVC